MRVEQTPLFTCLCITENRPAFLPWLLWNYDKQTWTKRELIIVDSSPTPFESARPDIRVITSAPGTGVATKRNRALQAAQGELITWFDDDDWQHPEKLALLAEALQEEAVVCAGTRHGWFVNLDSGRCARHRGTGHLPIFNSAGFRRDAVLPLRFPEKLRRATDTRWMQGLRRRYPGRYALLDREDLFFWLCHGANLSNPAKKRRFPQELTALKTVIGDSWGETGRTLSQLSERLTPDGASETAGTRARAQSGVSRARTWAKKEMMQQQKPLTRQTVPIEGREEPAVGLVVKATVMDTPYLDTMVRHMIAQADYPFTERIVVVDQPSAFRGKYRARPLGSQAQLDAILEELQQDDLIDRVLDVDYGPETVREIMGRYFATGSHPVPTHATTGGPIYPTLLAMESLSSNYVLQMDADVFFYSNESWVRRALPHLQQDPDIWLMMTHPGPPAGPPGRSLGSRNAAIATWDAARSLWLFQSCTTRYFLCDRRRLRGRLRPLWRGQGCLPLEQCISHALKRHHAYRGMLGDLRSWHLHAWHHGEPFPAWAQALAAAVAAGHYPAVQKGHYDLRLDRPRDRSAWQQKLQQLDLLSEVTTRPGRLQAVTNTPAARTAARSERAREQEQAPVATTTADNVAPLTVVVPVRDRAGRRLRNALHSLLWQEDVGRPAKILVVSYGSKRAIDRELAAICAETGAILACAGSPADPWNKPLALNIGIRQVSPAVPYIMTMDADMILAPNFLSVVLGILQQHPPTLVLCRSADLPRHISLPDPHHLRARFSRLQKQSRLRSRTGTGGIQAATREFFYDIRGYDEDLLWWGAMDGDIVNRARLVGLRVEWIEDRTTMLHQWHRRKHQSLQEAQQVAQARNHWLRNHELVRQRAESARRNARGWGGVTE